MRMSRIWVCLAVSALAAGLGGAQDYNNTEDEEQPRRRTEIPSAGFWPTERMFDFAIDRITEQMAREYAFDEDQLWNTRDTLKERFPRWMQENRAELQSLLNRYVEAVIAGEPPTREEVADWARRALPLLDEFTGLVEETSEEMRTYLTDEQQVLLDGQMAAMRVAMNYMDQRMTGWSEGGYDWESEWPRSEQFRASERERRQRLEREAERAKLIEMGLDPDAAGGPAGGETAGDPGKRARPGRRSATPKDEWALYVEAFIKRYELSAAQQNSARKFLRDQQYLRDKYLRRRLPDINAIEQKLKAAKTDEQREKVRAELEHVNRPIERYFQRLKERLDTLPTRKQRAAAARAEMVARAKAETATKAAGTEKAEESDRKNEKETETGGG